MAGRAPVQRGRTNDVIGRLNEGRLNEGRLNDAVGRLNDVVGRL
jgi:hypothetical protein